MPEFRTGALSLDDLEAEILAIVDDLKAAHVDTVYVTYGFGCADFNAMGRNDALPVLLAELPSFISLSEERGVFELGEADLEIEGGGVTYTLCHERDAHCAGPARSALLWAVRERWRSQYPDCYEVNPHGKPRYLSDRDRA